MSKNPDEFERTIGFGEYALAQMKAHRTSAYPRIYELWYTYATGYNTVLNEALDALVSGSAAAIEDELDKIYEAHLSPLRFSAQVDEVGTRVVNEIDSVVTLIDSAMGHTGRFGDELRQSLLRMAAVDGDKNAVLSLVDSLMQLTQGMEVSNRVLEARLRDSRSEIRALQDGLNAARTESLTDPMTSLANRKAFDTAIVTAMQAAREADEPLALLITDIDKFKRFNDTYGHLTGDQVLRLVAMAIKQNVKGVDLAARFGGEEFAVILPNTPLRSATTVAEHMRRAVVSKELIKRSTGETLGRITISIGVATLRPNDTPTTLIDRADMCLYAAKRGGRNRVICETDPEVAEPAAVA